MSATLLDVEAVRRRFFSLQGGFAFLDAPGGSQVPDEVGADRGFEVDWVDVTDDLRLDLDDLQRKLDERTRLVAFVAASNAVGTVTDVQRVAELAREAGALSWVDAVHYAAHEPLDVEALGVDVLLCSPYKFCGPHLGLAYGRHELPESRRPYKSRPAPNAPAGRRLETGTAPYELLAGFTATIAYLDSLGGVATLREYERSLGARFLESLPDSVAVYGLQTMEGRVPTFLLNVGGVDAAEVATTMAARGYGVWAHDNWYSVGLREHLPYPRDAVRVGFIHYNTADEVDGFVRELATLAA